MKKTFWKNHDPVSLSQWQCNFQNSSLFTTGVGGTVQHQHWVKCNCLLMIIKHHNHTYCAEYREISYSSRKSTKTLIYGILTGCVLTWSFVSGLKLLKQKLCQLQWWIRMLFDTFIRKLEFRWVCTVDCMSVVIDAIKTMFTLCAVMSGTVKTKKCL